MITTSLGALALAAGRAVALTAAAPAAISQKVRLETTWHLAQRSDRKNNRKGKKSNCTFHWKSP
jgi:hypothetical protein